MSLRLGIDTGGTFTDAVLVDDNKQIVNAEKSLTTRFDLSLGIGDVVAKLPAASLGEVSMVSLSTTLTTNSVVEDLGAPVCVLLPGYSSEQIKQSGLRGRGDRGDDGAEAAAGRDGALVVGEALDRRVPRARIRSDFLQDLLRHLQGLRRGACDADVAALAPQVLDQDVLDEGAEVLAAHQHAFNNCLSAICNYSVFHTNQHPHLQPPATCNNYPKL